MTADEKPKASPKGKRARRRAAKEESKAADYSLDALPKRMRKVFNGMFGW